MSKDITDTLEALSLAVDMAKGMFSKDDAAFAVFMCGVLTSAVQDLCQHVAALEEKLAPSPAPSGPTAADRERWREEIAAAKANLTADEFTDWLYRKINSVGLSREEKS